MRYFLWELWDSGQVKQLKLIMNQTLWLISVVLLNTLRQLFRKACCERMCFHTSGQRLQCFAHYLLRRSINQLLPVKISGVTSPRMNAMNAKTFCNQNVLAVINTFCCGLSAVFHASSFTDEERQKVSVNVGLELGWYRLLSQHRLHWEVLCCINNQQWYQQNVVKEWNKETKKNVVTSLSCKAKLLNTSHSLSFSIPVIACFWFLPL